MHSESMRCTLISIEDRHGYGVLSYLEVISVKQLVSAKGGHLTMKKSWRVWTVAFTLLTGMTLVSCTSTEPDSVVMQTPTEPAQEEGQTITIIPTDQEKNGVDTTKYQIQTRLTDFHLFDGNSGIAWGVTRNALRLYYTHDGGVTWTNISPSENIPFPGELHYGTEILFADAQNGWIVRQAWGSADTIVLRTSNGGETWNIAALPDSGTVEGIHFTDGSNGWIASELAYSGRILSRAVYRTTNGGASWSRQMTNPNIDGQVVNNVSELLPLKGEVTGIHFTDDEHGFVSMNVNNRPRIYNTSDQGRSWAPSKAVETPNACSAPENGAPQFRDIRDPDGWMPLQCDKNGYISYSGYFTADGGRNHWQYAQLNLRVPMGMASTVPTFLNDRQGWVLVGPSVYYTEDGGKVWTSLGANKVLLDMLEKYPEPVKMRFASSKVGWLLIEKAEDRKSLLMQTIDGGRTWKVL